MLTMVYGYTRKDRNGYWCYSVKAEQEIKEYKEKFPEVFVYLTKNPGFDDVHGKELYPENTEEKLAELGAWLKERGSCAAERQTCGAEVLDEQVVAAIEKHIDSLDSDSCEKPVTFSAKPSMLYKPKPKLGQAPDPRASYRLYDRVVNVRESHTVPLGARGTIIGIHNADKGLQAMYDIVFDKPFTGGLKLRCSPHRGYRLPVQAFINLSYGTASEAARSSGKPMAVVEPSGTEEAGGFNNNNGHSSAFASWRNKPNYDIGASPNQNGTARQRSRGGADTDHRSPRHQYNLQQRSAGADPLNTSQEFNLRPEHPRGPPYSQSNPPPPPPPLSTQQAAPSQLSSEYFEMFKQLQKAGNNTNTAKPVPSVQDSSDALKKILRIAENKSSVPPPVQHQPPHQHQQPTKTIQFKKPTKPLPHQEYPQPPRTPQQQPLSQPPNNHYYVMRLLSLHQSRGLRLPKYHYLDQYDDTITCTVECGNGKEFKGRPAYDNEQAAENAALLALSCMAMDERALLEQCSYGPGGIMIRPDQRNYGPGPHGPKRHPPNSYQTNSSLAAVGWAREPPATLPQPPVNWYQNKSFQPDWQSKAAGAYLPPSQRFQQSQGHHPPHGPPPFPQVGGMTPFIPLQALSKKARQQPQSAPPPHQAPAYHQELPRQAPQSQKTAQKEHSGQRQSKPASSGRTSTRPPRSRLAANFSKPLKFDSPDSSQDTQ